MYITITIKINAANWNGNKKMWTHCYEHQYLIHFDFCLCKSGPNLRRNSGHVVHYHYAWATNQVDLQFLFCLSDSYGMFCNKKELQFRYKFTNSISQFVYINTHTQSHTLSPTLSQVNYFESIIETNVSYSNCVLKTSRRI